MLESVLDQCTETAISSSSGNLEIPEMYVTPMGALHVEDRGDQALSALVAAQDAGEFMLSLLQQSSIRYKGPSFNFFYAVAETFMQAVCTHADCSSLGIPLRSGLIDEWVLSCPPIKGGEYVDRNLFASIWRQLSDTFWRQCGRRPVREFLAEQFPLWADAGRVYLHIAENRIHESKPFTVLLTYAVRDSDKARLQHRPLGLALSDAGKTDDPKLVESLLRAIGRAASASREFARLQADRSLYRPLHLTPGDAFRLVKEFPAIEGSGLLCKVPEYWENGRPETPKVEVTFKTGPKTSTLGTSGVLSFDVGVALGDSKLTPEEVELLLEARDSLVMLRGRWVEVDSRKIDSLLTRWQKAVALAGDNGMSFGEAMRWTAGLGGLIDNTTGEDVIGEEEATDRHLTFKTDEHLTALLRSVRCPDESHYAADQRIINERIRATLRPYQIQGVSWLRSVAKLGMGGCLADDMGLGKTLQIITLLTLIKESQSSTQPSLLIVPASLIGNWQSEIEKFSPGLRIWIFHPSAETYECSGNDLGATDLVITTYGMITRESWLRDYKWNIIVADEAQAIKNPGTKQSLAVRSLQANVRFALSGTPIENNLTDLWSIFDFAIPGLLGNKQTFSQFVKVKTPEQTDFSALRTVINPWILRRKKNDPAVISDLPDKTEVKSYCFLTRKQAQLYKKQVEQTAIVLAEADGIARKGQIFSTIMKLKQICNHPSQREGDGSYDPSLSGKFQKLIELCGQIAERQEKVLVFTQFRELTDIIAHELERVFRKPGLILHGAVPVDRRRTLVDRFQAESGPPFFVLSLKAGGTGLNLTAASHVIHFDRWWNPAVENQATDRAYRIGQKRNVLVHKFICKGTIEESIDLLIESKKSLAEDVVGTSAEIHLSSMTDEELLDLMRFRGHPGQDTGIQPSENES